MSAKRNINWDQVLAEAKELGLPCTKVARQQGVSNAVVTKAKKKRGIHLVHGSRRRDWRGVLDDALKRGLSQSDVAREQGVSRVAVHNHCHALGVKLRHGNGRRAA